MNVLLLWIDILKLSSIPAFLNALYKVFILYNTIHCIIIRKKGRIPNGFYYFVYSVLKKTHITLKKIINHILLLLLIVNATLYYTLKTISQQLKYPQKYMASMWKTPRVGFNSRMCLPKYKYIDARFAW